MSDSCNEGFFLSSLPSILKIEADTPCFQISSNDVDEIAVCGGIRVIAMCFMSASMLN